MRGVFGHRGREKSARNGNANTRPRPRSRRDPALRNTSGPGGPSPRGGSRDVRRQALPSCRLANQALGGPRRRLAGRAVVAPAELVGVEADVDRRPAFVARHAPPLLHGAELPAIEHKTRAPRPAVAISPQKLARGQDDPAELVVVDLADLRPRPGASDEQRLVLDLVPDARKGALVEEGGRDVALGLGTEAAQAFLEIEVVGDHIRPE